MDDYRNGKRKDELIRDLLDKHYIFDAIIEAAFREVEMEDFLPEELKKYSYVDAPLPFYQNRPMAAPHINAIFLQLLQLEPGTPYKILQLSSMSGYFASLMAEITKSPIRIIEGDSGAARVTKANLKRSGYDQTVEVVEMDPIKAFWKFPESDRIIFCGAVSTSIIDEVAKVMPANAILIAPLFTGIFNPLMGQDMVRVIKSNGEITMESFGKVSFIIMQSPSFQAKASKTQELIFKQIEQTLEEYFTTTLPREEPLLDLNLPEHIMEDFLTANTLFKKNFQKAAIFQAILAVKESINYAVAEPLDFSKLDNPEMQLKLKEMLNPEQLRNLETLLDIEKTILNYDYQNPPNIENLAKMALDITSSFLESRFRK